MDLKDIKAIIDLMKKNSITEFELEQQDSKLRLKRGLNGGTSASHGDEPVPMVASQPVTIPVISAPLAAPAANTGEIDIKSPMIGTFYRSPSPEAESFVEVGQTVEIGQVVCIVEAMKLMNEIVSEYSGKIERICVNDGQLVTLHQELFWIET